METETEMEMEMETEVETAPRAPHRELSFPTRAWGISNFLSSAGVGQALQTAQSTQIPLGCGKNLQPVTGELETPLCPSLGQQKSQLGLGMGTSSHCKEGWDSPYIYSIWERL